MTSWKYPAPLAVALLLALVLVPGIVAAATEQGMDNENVWGILSGPTSPTTFTFSQPVTLTHLGTYHYHDKNKVVPLGTLGLRDASGKMYGPWKTTGLEGQGGVKDAFWDATPNVVIPAGTYTVVDSDPRTWSYNKQSNYQGFASVRYLPVGGSGGSSGGSSGPHFAWPTAEAFASAVATSALVGAFGFGGALFGAIVGGFTFIPPRGFQYPDRFGGGPTPYDPGYDAGWGDDSDGSGSGSGGSDGDGSDAPDAGDGGGEGDPGPGPSEGSAGSDNTGTGSGGSGAGSDPGAGGSGSPGGSGPIYGDGSKENPFRDYADPNAPPWAAPFGDGSANNPLSDTQQPVNDPGAEGGSDGGSSDTGSGEGGSNDGGGSSSGTGSGEGSGGSGSSSGRGSGAGTTAPSHPSGGSDGAGGEPPGSEGTTDGGTAGGSSGTGPGPSPQDGPGPSGPLPDAPPVAPSSGSDGGSPVSPGSGDQAPAPDPATKDWIGSRTVYPGTWSISADGTGIKVAGLAGEIPVGWVNGTSQNPVENTIFNTDLPVDDHQLAAENIENSLNETDSDVVNQFTKSQWGKLDDTQRLAAIQKIAGNIGSELGEGGVDIRLGTAPTDAHYDPTLHSDPLHPERGTVVINPASSYWQNPGDAIKMVGHEIKHQQQWNPLNPMEDSEARKAATINVQNYHEYSVDPTKYAGQYVENDSNSFGQAVREVIRNDALNNEEKKLFNFLDELKGPEPAAPKLTIEGIKQDPDGFLNYLKENPDQKAKFIEILKNKHGHR